MFCQCRILVELNHNFLIFAFAGVANAIDLADRFLPKLKSLNCKLNTSLIVFVVVNALCLVTICIIYPSFN